MNFGLRLDEILAGHREWMRGIRTDRLVGTSSEATKQAINSLIKELVAEAKPRKKNLLAATLKSDGKNRDRALRYSGYNHAIDQFEQNLLKALEEKNV